MAVDAGPRSARHVDETPVPLNSRSSRSSKLRALGPTRPRPGVTRRQARSIATAAGNGPRGCRRRGHRPQARPRRAGRPARRPRRPCRGPRPRTSCPLREGPNRAPCLRPSGPEIFVCDPEAPEVVDQPANREDWRNGHPEQVGRLAPGQAKRRRDLRHCPRQPGADIGADRVRVHGLRQAVEERTSGLFLRLEHGMSDRSLAHARLRPDRTQRAKPRPPRRAVRTGARRSIPSGRRHPTGRLKPGDGIMPDFPMPPGGPEGESCALLPISGRPHGCPAPPRPARLPCSGVRALL